MATTVAATGLEYPACAVCGREHVVVVCGADEIRCQIESLRRFHARRLRPERVGAAPHAALEDRADFTQSFVTNVVACGGCGLLFRDPRPNAAAITAAYASDAYGEERLLSLHTAQRDLYVTKVGRLRTWLPAGADVRVLEVGSFVGGFLVAAAREGWTIRGIDPGEEVVAFCAARGLPVVRAAVEELRLAAASLDCVAVWNTFDQLPNPHAALDVIARALRPGGVLAVRVPNGQAFRVAVTRLRRARGVTAAVLRTALAWNNLLGFPYLYGYSTPPLDRLLARYGLRRIATDPDTLVRLSDDATRRWAAAEEWALKHAWRLLWTARPSATSTAPWLDVYYRGSATRAAPPG